MTDITEIIQHITCNLSNPVQNIYVTFQDGSHGHNNYDILSAITQPPQVAEDIYDNGTKGVDTIIDWNNGQVQQIRYSAIINLSFTGWEALAPVGEGKVQAGTLIGLDGDLFAPTFDDVNRGPLPTYVAGFANVQELASLGPDGAIYNMWQVSNDQHVVLGVDGITNGGFDTDTDWTKNAGWTISGGEAHQSGTAFTELLQDPGVVDGSVWLIAYDVTAIDGTVRVIVGGTAGTDRTAVGSYVEVITAGATSLFAAFSMKNVGAKTCSIDNVVARRLY